MMKGLMEQTGTMLSLLKTPVSKMALIAIQLKIVLWNDDGLTQHAEEVKAYTQNEKVEIMLIYETHYTKKKKKNCIKIPKYTIHGIKHPDGTAHGGTTIIIKNGTKHYLHGHYNLEHLQATSVTIEDWIGPLATAAV